MTYDEARIARERAICDAATPGPWRQSGPYLVSRHDDWDGWIVTTDPEQDAEFIALARTGWPEALDEIERLRTALANVEAILDQPQFDLTQALALGHARRALNGGAS